MTAAVENPLMLPENRGPENDVKVCKCGAVFRRDPRTSAKQWARKRSCSRSCGQRKHQYDAPAMLADYARGVPLGELSERYQVPEYIIRAHAKRIGLRRRPDFDDHTLRERIFDGIKVNPLSGCWEWQGMLNVGGYAVITCRGDQRIAARVSFSVFCGRFDQALDISHRCDCRACLNPDHLFPADRAETMRDTGAKGRFASGEDLPQAKLSRAEVDAIRKHYAIGVSARTLAEDYDISTSQIYNIINGRTWRRK